MSHVQEMDIFDNFGRMTWHVQEMISPISEYYDGRSILITGGTGFMGKVLLEKLLRSCPGITRIYVLIRPKKGIKPQDRLNIMLESRLFANLKHVSPFIFIRIWCPHAGLF